MNESSASLNTPLLLMVDDQPEQEIFPRLATLLVGLEIPESREFYDRILAREKAIHVHPMLRVAWARDGQGLLELIQGSVKTLVFMDLFWEQQPDGSGFGVRLSRELLKDPYVQRHSVFLLKSRLESASADAFRKEQTNYLRIQRSLFGHSETTERMQFLGANLDPNVAATPYELQRIAPLLLSLMEEEFADRTREQVMAQSEFAACIESFRQHQYFNVFKGHPKYQRRFEQHLRETYCDFGSVANFSGCPIALGALQRGWIQQDRTADVKKAFISQGKEPRALELALLRHGQVAAIEALLFVLPTINAKNEIEPLSGGIIDQKWNPNKYDALTVCSVKAVVDALELIDEIVNDVRAEGNPPRYDVLRASLSPDHIVDNGLSETLLALIEIKAGLRTFTTSVAYDLMAPALSRIESVLLPKPGLMVMPVDMGLLFTGEQTEAPRWERFSRERKVYCLINRDRIQHNLSNVSKLLKGNTDTLTEPSLLVSALHMDSMSPQALKQLSALAERDSIVFKEVLNLLEQRVQVGLPHPDRLNDWYSSEDDSGRLRGIEFYLEDPKNKPQADKGYDCTLLELVVGGLHVLKYHIESFCRLATWSLQADFAESEELLDCLRNLWTQRGWDRLFVPAIPCDCIDPLADEWGKNVNLLKAIESTNEIGRVVSERWSGFLQPYGVHVQGRRKNEVSYGKLPPDWLRIYSLNLPLDIAAVLVDKRGGSAEILQRQSVISVIRDLYKGDPYEMHERLQRALIERGIDFQIREPVDGFNWEYDDQFILELETAMDLLRG